jgi:hypothetical protein
MSIEFRFLADYADALTTVADWYFGEWGYFGQGHTLEQIKERLKTALNRSKIPFVLVAIDQGQIVGSAELKYGKMEDVFPETEPWLEARRAGQKSWCAGIGDGGGMFVPQGEITQ